MKTDRNKIKNTTDLTIEITRTELELQYAQNELKKNSVEMGQRVISQTLNIYSIANIGFNLAKRAISALKDHLKKKKDGSDK